MAKRGPSTPPAMPLPGPPAPLLKSISCPAPSLSSAHQELAHGSWGRAGGGLLDLLASRSALFPPCPSHLPWDSVSHSLGSDLVTIAHQALLSVRGILQASLLEWVAIPFSGGSSQPRDQTQVSCITGRFFTIWARDPFLTPALALPALEIQPEKTEGRSCWRTPYPPPPPHSLASDKVKSFNISEKTHTPRRYKNHEIIPI